MKNSGNHAAKIRKLEAAIAKLAPKVGKTRRKSGQEASLNDLLTELATELAHEVERLRAINERDAAERQARRERVASTVHDLKVPVTISLLNLELTEMESDEQEKVNYVTGVRRELEFLLDTIGNLLDIEHAETEAMQMKREALDLRALVEGVVDRMKVLVNDKPNLLILNELPDGLPLLQGDRHKLVRVFNNLISNSIKYTESGTIIVGMEPNKNNRRIILSVRDSGFGIEADRLPELFQFFRGDALRQDSSGVGLAFVKQAVTAHGGKVWLESERNAGTAVFLDLPLKGH